MPDETTPTGQEPSGGTTAPVAGDGQGKQNPEQTVEELRALLEKERKDRQDANKEAQTHRAKLREYEKAEEERQKASLSEQERTRVELDEARKALEELQAVQRDTALRAAVAITAQKHNVVDAEAAYKLLDQSKLKFDERGAPTNADEVVAELVKERPWLIQAVGASVANIGKGDGGARVGREAELRELVYGRGATVFDPSRIVQSGGGVRKAE